MHEHAAKTTSRNRFSVLASLHEQKKLVQYIHTLRREPFRVAAVGNCSIFETSAPLDAAVWEGDPTDTLNHARPNDLFPTRYLLGVRAIHTFAGATMIGLAN